MTVKRYNPLDRLDNRHRHFWNTVILTVRTVNRTVFMVQNCFDSVIAQPCLPQSMWYTKIYVSIPKEIPWPWTRQTYATHHAVANIKPHIPHSTRIRCRTWYHVRNITFKHDQRLYPFTAHPLASQTVPTSQFWLHLPFTILGPESCIGSLNLFFHMPKKKAGESLSGWLAKKILKNERGQRQTSLLTHCTNRCPLNFWKFTLQLWCKSEGVKWGQTLWKSSSQNCCMEGVKQF